MKIEAEVLADSICNGYRITSLRVVAPRIILAEVNTHGSLAKSCSSLRAVPIKVQLQRVMEHPFIPLHFGKNQKGMQASEEVSEEARVAAIKVWLEARDRAVEQVQKLADLKIHKQVANRLLSPFVWDESVWTATEWDNLNALRNHSDAQPEFYMLAKAVHEARQASTPKELQRGEWHLPFVKTTDTFNYSFDPIYVSMARCARASYYLPEGGFSDLERDILKCKELIAHGHWVPGEHPAQAVGYFHRHARYVGWRSFRHTHPNECHGDYTFEKYKNAGAIIDLEQQSED